MERRICFSGNTLLTAQALSFDSYHLAHATNFLAKPGEVDLYRVTLGAGDRIDATISAQTSGSGLTSLLRIFDVKGTQLALDNQEGGDPQLAFQVPSAGFYYVGVSSAPNDNYDPQVADSGTTGGTTGLYNLNLRDTPLGASDSLKTDLTGSSFRLGTDTAAWGEAVPVTFAVENRGASAADTTAQVRLLLSDNNTFAATSHVFEFPQTFSLAGLATGQAYPSGSLTVTLPDLASARAHGFSLSGPVFLGVRITEDPRHDVSSIDKSGVHRGADWEELTILTPAPAGTRDLSSVDPSLNIRANGQLVDVAQVDTYSLTVSTAVGSGRLTATVASTTAGFTPRLILYGVNGQALLQSDTGRIVETLATGLYSLVVSADAGIGGYRLTSQFSPASQPLEPIAAGSNPGSVAVADLNGDGRLDLIVADRQDTVTIRLGNGDGTFRPARTFAAGSLPFFVTVADVNGDSKPDLIVADNGGNQVSVLLGNGDGTFQTRKSFGVGISPRSVVVADLNGDGKPDLIVADAGDGGTIQATVSVFLGNGDGSFQSPTTLATGGAVAVGDMNGDGIPDLVVLHPGTGAVNGTVSVSLGNGDGSFENPQTFATGLGQFPSSVVVADVNGDGKPDLMVGARDNFGVSTISLMLGNGDGTLQFPKPLSGGDSSSQVSLAVADVNGDGKPDLVETDGLATLSVLLNNGDGTFQASMPFRTDFGSYSPVVADINGDGKPDLVTANLFGGRDLFLNGTVSVLLGNGDGTFQDQQAFAAGHLPSSLVVADFNSDGRPDLIVLNQGDNTVGVLLGNGDGTFQPQQTFGTGTLSLSATLAVADINSDGRPDILVSSNGTLMVLLGNGDGSFQPHQTQAHRSFSTVADVNGDGIPDLVAANFADNSVGIMLGNGDGTFQDPKTFFTETGPRSVTVADVNGDGKPDLIVVNRNSSFADVVNVLLGNDDGTFQDRKTFAIGSFDAANVSLAVADVNGDGKPDLVATSEPYSNFGGKVSVLLGNGDGTFKPAQSFDSNEPSFVAVADVNGDGKPDLVVVSARFATLSALLGNGDGSFQAPTVSHAGNYPSSVAVADVNGDGKPDVLLINGGAFDNTVHVLLGNGGVHPPQTYAVGAGPDAVTFAPVNSDVFQGLLVANATDKTVSVLQTDLRGFFQPQQVYPVGGSPSSVLMADANGDNIPDLITVNSADNSVSVLLGNRDGTFQPAHTYAVGLAPTFVAVTDFYGGYVALSDFNGDGFPDLVTGNSGDDSLSVLLGDGHGSFSPAETFAIGLASASLAVADVNGDGRADLISVNTAENTVSVRLGNGDGTFSDPQNFAVGKSPVSVVAADLNGDNIPDLVVANQGDGTLSVLIGNGDQSLGVGDGTFQAQMVLSAGVAVPSSVRLAGDANQDLLVADSANETGSLLLGSNNGDATFRVSQTFALHASPNAVAEADLNRDGKSDLVIANFATNTVTLNLGDGTVTFTPSTPTIGAGLRSTPYLLGDGSLDSVILDSAGNILLRKGLAGFPVILNNKAMIGADRPARDLTVLKTRAGWAIAAADTSFDPTLSAAAGHFVYTVSVYTVAADGSVTRSTAFASPFGPTRIAGADLTGKGVDDIVVADSLDNCVQVALQQPNGTFNSPLTMPVGLAPSDLALVDLDDDGRKDIVVSNQASATVTVLLNDKTHSFTRVEAYRAGIGPSEVVQGITGPTVSSRDQSVSLAVGNLTGSGRNHLAVVNRGAHSFNVLANVGSGFGNPQAAQTTSTSAGLALNNRAGAVVGGDFHGTDGLDSHRAAKGDLAILMEDRGEVWIYTNKGDGSFTPGQRIPIGTLATGLTVVPGSSAELFDLLVGDEFGDILRLVGKGDGTFTPPPPVTGDRVPLDIQSLKGDSTPDLLVANQATNRITIQVPTANGTTFTTVQTLAADPNSHLAPGAVQWAKLEGMTGLFDAVALASGSNSVLVYHTTTVDPVTGLPTFAPPVTYPVGTDPVAVTIQDINGDGIADMLVANKGSNDISILFGSIVSGVWNSTPGPRLQSGGNGPIATTLLHVKGSNVPDLLVTNSASGTLTDLPGRSQGFFDDRPGSITTFGANGPIVQSLVDSSGLEFVVRADGGLSTFDGQSFKDVFDSSLDKVTLIADQDGTLVAAFTNGNVDILKSDANGRYQISDEDPASLTHASAMEVLRGLNGLEVYLTRAGDGVPIILTGADFIPLVTELPTVTIVGLATNFAEADLALIPTAVVVSVNDLVDLGSAGERFGVSLETFASLGSIGRQEGSLYISASAQVPNVPSETPLSTENITPVDRYRIGLEESIERLLQQRRAELQEERPENTDSAAPRTQPKPVPPADMDLEEIKELNGDLTAQTSPLAPGEPAARKDAFAMVDVSQCAFSDRAPLAEPSVSSGNALLTVASFLGGWSLQLTEEAPPEFGPGSNPGNKFKLPDSVH